MRIPMLTLSLLAIGPAALPLAAQAACEELASLDLPGVTITVLESVPAGEFALEGGRGGTRRITDLPAFCRIGATLSPVPGSGIGIELWLPSEAAWNGRYVALGNGGFAGSIGTNAMLDPLRRGYAASSTDTGHTSPGGAFALDEVARVDFAYRAVHEMAETSKRLIEAYYGRAHSYAFFSGCSTGGRQALAAAQRFPGDFDGIVAGAPASHVTHLQGQQLWMSRVGRQEGSTPIPPEKFSLINDAVIESCDLNDGVADRVIENPLACSVDPRSLACADSESAACLSTGEVSTLARLYLGPTTSGGASIFPGSVPGSESGWGQMTGPQPLELAVDTYRYMVFGDPDWSVGQFDAERDIAYAESVIGETMNAIDPDLGPLAARGGKLLLYHGWADPGITPMATVNYYENVLGTMGPRATDTSRLFMVPGMGHCGGGEGPGTFDAIGIIDDWVTSLTPPDRIVASRTRGGAVDRTRPLCPYPQIAVYNGTGSTDMAENFTCGRP